MVRPYTILVADDDPSLLDVLAMILREPGYTVLTAGDAYEAIRVLADRHVDLMVADVRMPGLTGPELSLQAKVMRPKLHLIFITGYAVSPETAQQGRVIPKPIRSAALLKIVEQELSAI